MFYALSISQSAKKKIFGKKTQLCHVLLSAKHSQVHNNKCDPTVFNGQIFKFIIEPVPISFMNCKVNFINIIYMPNL